MQFPATDTAGTLSKQRLYVGGAVFIAGFTAPLLIPLVTQSSLSTEWKAALAGLLALGIPEIFMFVAVAILGKEGYKYLKSRLWRIIAPPETVSVTRYRLGLVLFILPVLFGWLQPYLENWQPVFAQHRILLGIIGDMLFVLSLFLLGGEFWDKVRALFSQKLQVVTHSRAAVASNQELAVVQVGLSFYTGSVLFVLSLILPVFIPLVTFIPVSTELKVGISGLMVVGFPQLLMILAVAVLGKPGFQYIKQRAGTFIRGLFPKTVGPVRYRTGLVLFLTPLFIAILFPYLAGKFSFLNTYATEIAIIGDILIIVSLLVLGGEFWDKLRALFIHKAKVGLV